MDQYFILNSHTSFTIKQIGPGDTGIAISNCIIDRNATLNLKIINKFDEIWFGLSSDISLLEHTGAYYNRKHCVGQQGGRKRLIEEVQDSDTFQVVCNEMGANDTWQGNIQESIDSQGNRFTQHKLQPIQDNDYIKIKWEHETQIMNVFHNDRQMVTHQIRKRFSSDEKLFVQVVGDIQNDQYQMWICD